MCDYSIHGGKNIFSGLLTVGYHLKFLNHFSQLV